MTGLRRLAMIEVGIVAVVAAGLLVVANRDRLLLPDLRPAPPSALGVSTVSDEGGGRRFLLGFQAAIENVGDGPLVIEGRRAAGDATMTVTQLIARAGGGWTSRPVDGGTLHYERGPDHSHWHYQPAIIYRLYHTDGRLARAGTKAGFCLGDRYLLAGPRPPATPAEPRYIGFCGRHQPQLTSLRQGISVGYGDDYPGFLEGQSLDVTGLPAGTYRLEHETDPDRLLTEVDRGNNIAAITITLAWPDGPERRPTVTIVATA